MKKTGGCLCGQVRYETKAEPMMTGVCHCKNCQKQAGSAFSTQRLTVHALEVLPLVQPSKSPKWSPDMDQNIIAVLNMDKMPNPQECEHIIRNVTML